MLLYAVTRQEIPDVMAVPLPHDSSNAAFDWFTEYQRSCILKNGIVPEWFHGIISRKVAEDMLMCKPPGYFLVRVSESRVGYTLSYRADDRYRHFMIDVLPDNQYIIVGEKTCFSSLHDLVAFHRRNPILPYNDLLTVACEQGGKNNYAELLFPQKKDANPGEAEWINLSTPTRAAHSDISEHNPTSPLKSESFTLPTSPSARLYPSLETEMSSLNLQSMNQSAKPTLKPRTIFMSKPPADDTPPQLPSRACLPNRPQATAEADRSQGAMPPVSSDRHQIPLDTPVEGRTQQKPSKPVVMGFAHIKKKLKKNRSKDHMYEEITQDASQENAAFSTSESSNLNPKQLGDNDYQELTETSTVGGRWASDGIPISADRKLPLEYLNPPPFAPGY